MRGFARLLALGAVMTACGLSPLRTPDDAAPLTCPGSPPLRCLTAPECAYDRARHCTECRCSPATGVPAAGVVNAESVPPIH